MEQYVYVLTAEYRKEENVLSMWQTLSFKSS